MTVVDTHGLHGPAVAGIKASDMASKMMSLDDVRSKLALTEPIGQYGFPVGDSVRFRVEPGWNHTLDALDENDKVEAYVRLGKGGGAKEYQLTKTALLEATSAVGLPRGYVAKTPAKLVEPQLNYWFREGMAGKDYKLLTVGTDDVGAALVRSTINPFSNVRLLDETLASIEKKYGKGQLFADYKFQHSLEATHLRLIIPETTRTLKNTGTDDDTWSVGIQIMNSLTGAGQTSLEGYLFRWWCTNGAIDTHASSGKWSRRGASGQTDEVYNWARESVDEILGGLEHSLDKVQELTDIKVNDEVVDVLHDIFQTYKVPGPHREAVIKNMAEEDTLTMYSVMNAVTQAANASDMPYNHVVQMLRAGGDLPHTAHARCGACHRIMEH